MDTNLGAMDFEGKYRDFLHHQLAGDYPSAIAGYQQILQADPQHSRAWHALGTAYLQSGDATQAIDAIRRAIALDGTKAAYHNNLGVALLAQDLLQEAKDAFAAAVALDPRYADAVANLGLAHAKMGLPDAAVQLYRQAILLEPRHINALFNLANLLADRGDAQQAIGFYQQALDAGGARADILNNLGRVLLDNHQPAEAGACFEKALHADPRCGAAAFNAGKAYAQEERGADAERAFAVAARLRPHKALWKLQRLGVCPTVFQSVAELDDYRAELERRLDEALQEPRRVEIDALAEDGFVPSFNLAHHGRSNRRLLEKFAALFSPHIPQGNPRFNLGKRRVGFVVTAPHVGSFLRTQAGIVELLDPKRFEVTVCCADAGLAKLRQGIRRDDVQWVAFAPRFREAAATIAAASCDVLYFHKVSADPLGYLLPFARLAPVQCTSWCTHFTSGVSEVDYYLSSDLLEADDAVEEYTEELVRLKAFPSYEKAPSPVPPASRADFGLPAHGSLYLCPQRLAKFHPDQDALFRQILDADATGIIILLAGSNPIVLGQLLARFGRTLGSAAKRIVVLPPQGARELRQLMSVCDALLDIHHYSASLMANDAFAAGLPIVTLPGRFKVERYALGFYRRLGIDDLIAASPEEYVRLANRLGTDADFRQAMRKRVRSVSHRLFEDRQTVLDFANFAERAIRRH